MGVLTDFDLLLGSVLKHHVFRRWLGVVPTGVLGNKHFDSVGVCGVLLKKYSAQLMCTKLSSCYNFVFIRTMLKIVVFNIGNHLLTLYPSTIIPDGSYI
jgi:hypothetical protein